MKMSKVFPPPEKLELRKKEKKGKITYLNYIFSTDPEKYVPLFITKLTNQDDSYWSIFATTVLFKIYYNLKKIKPHEHCKIEHLILSD